MNAPANEDVACGVALVGGQWWLLRAMRMPEAARHIASVLEPPTTVNLHRRTPPVSFVRLTNPPVSLASRQALTGRSGIDCVAVRWYLYL